MQYPLISEYIEAIRYAEDNFDKLSNLRPCGNSWAITLKKNRVIAQLLSFMPYFITNLCMPFWRVPTTAALPTTTGEDSKLLAMSLVNITSPVLPLMR